MSDPIRRKIDDYYTGKLRDFGPTPRGVDWNSEQSQTTRFAQLARLLPQGEPYSVLDYGCGYGAFLDYLRSRGDEALYQGFDVSEAMVATARALHVGDAASFGAERLAVEPADYVVASGIFSVKMDVATQAWEQYIEATLDDMNELGQRGFAFNLLTSHSDPDRMRPDLYYASPVRYFERCLRYSRWVALLHDYGLYEFTLAVRKS
jgi:predicted TPR repeat methyltransferase